MAWILVALLLMTLGLLRVSGRVMVPSIPWWYGVVELLLGEVLALTWLTRSQPVEDGFWLIGSAVIAGVLFDEVRLVTRGLKRWRQDVRSEELRLRKFLGKD
ncbi:MAG: hypothetical protein HY703_09440 [Gemmatimonadetes bacterium]|nr:hypothetical protein [Gemmatimonadota bacterium]